MINIKGLDKAQLLVELYNHSKQQGVGMLQQSRCLTLEDAKKLLEETSYFDYLYGKVMKVDLSKDDEVEERLYDRDNGQGAIQTIVDEMRKELEKASLETTNDVQKKNFVEPEPINNYINEYDRNTNIGDSSLPKTIDLPIDATGAYMGIYSERVTDEYGRTTQVVKIGLFKKDKVYKIEGRKPVQSYKDIISGNTAGLLLYEDSSDVITSVKDLDLLSADYSVNFYSSLMQSIEEKNGIKPFTAEIVGLGLVKLEQFNPSLKGNVHLSQVLESLSKFNSACTTLDKRVADPKAQATILTSIKQAPSVMIDNLPTNEIDLSKLPEDFNTIKHH